MSMVGFRVLGLIKTLNVTRYDYWLGVTSLFESVRFSEGFPLVTFFQTSITLTSYFSSPVMIEHTVTFRLRHAIGSEQEQDFLRAAAALVNIPGVRDFKIRCQTSVKNSHQYGISMHFETQVAYEAYNTHPQHVAFVQNRWLVEVEDFLEADFEEI